MNYTSKIPSLQPAIFLIKPEAIYHLPTCCCEVSQGVVVVDNSLLLAVTLAQAAVEAVDKALGGHRAPDVVLTMHGLPQRPWGHGGQVARRG